MRLTLLAATLALAWGVAGCSSEAPPYDDGSQAVPLAGLGGAVNASGFEVVGASAPSDATPAEVVAALDDAGVDGADVGPDTSALAGVPSPGSTAGLVALVGPEAAEEGQVLALVFGDPSSAAVYVASDPDAPTSDDGVAATAELLGGNVVAYAWQGADAELVRTALRALAAPTGP